MSAASRRRRAAFGTLAGLAAVLVSACTGAPGPGLCQADVHCPSGQRCVFNSAGCGAVGVCSADLPCTRPLATYCGCYGGAFTESCAGPRVPWLYQGTCGHPPDASVDAPSTDAPGTDATMDGLAACGDARLCTRGLACCGGSCVNLANDPLHCGTCATLCGGDTPMCTAGACTPQLCVPACDRASVCCLVDQGGPDAPVPACHAGVGCPIGCADCR